MRKVSGLLTTILIVVALGCGDDDDGSGGTGGGIQAGTGGSGGTGGGSNGPFSCNAPADQACIDFYGPGWTESDAQDTCNDLSSENIPGGDHFFPDSSSGNLSTDSECPTENRVGTCEIAFMGDTGIRYRIYSGGSHNHDSQSHKIDCGLGTYTEN